MKAKKFTLSDIGTVENKTNDQIFNADINNFGDRDSKGPGLKGFIKSNRGIIGVVAISTMLILISLFSIYQITRYIPKDAPQLVKHNKGYLAAAIQINDLLPNVKSPEEPRTEVSPLNGRLFTKDEMSKMMERRPVAVMINNHVEARPQSNLQQADIVYETLAEGGITRLMPIYWSNNPEKVGPIRSARQYYIDWLREYDAIYLHDGCASADSDGDLRVDACGNLYRQKIKTLTTYGAWRDNSQGKVAPHNEYTSVKAAVERGNQLGWEGFPSSIPAWKFKRDERVDLRGNMGGVTASFLDRLGSNNGYAYDVRWDYDKESNIYLRSTGSKAHTDQESGLQLTANVVIVQTVDGLQSGDSKGHLIIKTTGEGKATIFQDGKATQATWRKANETDRTKYYDSSGNEVQFNRGLIWIMAIPDGWGRFDIIAQ